MSTIVMHSTTISDVTMLKLTREIAMDIHPIEQLLDRYEVDPSQWETAKDNPRFKELLRSAIEEWNSATNTSERVRLKSLHFVEEALPEFYARAHDPKEGLAAKNEVLKTVARFAGIGGSGIDGASMGERLSVTINLGADHQLKIEKDVTSRVIDGEALTYLEKGQ